MIVNWRGAGQQTFGLHPLVLVWKGGAAAAVTLTLSGNPGPGITCVPYSFALIVTGGVPPYTFSITQGGLPPGLTLNPATGVISGIPGASSGTFEFTVKVTDSLGNNVSTKFSITIAGSIPAYFADGVHLVGDWRNGNLYLQSMNLNSDACSPRRWVRRAPNLINLNNRNTFYRFELFMGVGQVPQYPNPGWNPLVGLRFSDDGGLTWSNDKPAYAGKTGKYGWRVIWRQLGSGRDRVFEVYGQDPINISLVEAYVRLVPGNG